MSNRSHSQRAFSRTNRTSRFGGDLFPSAVDTPSPVVERNKRPIPDAELLADHGITVEEFTNNHSVVMCSECQSSSARNSFLMLKFCKNAPGEKRIAIGARPQVKGTNRNGETRIIWTIAPGLTCMCDDGHITRMDSVTGELSCINVSRERSELERIG